MSHARSVRILVAALAVTVFAIGASGCDAVADRAAQEAEQAVEDATGIAVDAGGENALSEGWPQDVPIIPDARIDSSASVQSPEGTVHTARLLTTEPFQDVVDWYAAELAAQEWTIAQQATMGSGDSATGVFTASKGPYDLVVTVSISQGEVAVDLQVLETP